MNSSTPSVLVLVPAYNEEQRIEPMLRDYTRFFRQEYTGMFRIVVVLNGCKDNTLEVVQRVAVEYPEVSALNFPAPIGKGGALIEGLRLAPQADLIGYVDADGASPPQAFRRLIDLAPQADCVIASRWLPGAVLHQSQPLLRRFTSRVFHAFVQLLFRMNIQDTQCPCKLIRRAAVEHIRPSLCIADLAFDVNLLVSLKREGYTILETPTEWTDKQGSKVTGSLFRLSLAMLLSVVRLRVIYSPFYPWLRPLHPVAKWIYRKLLRAPPLPSEYGGDASSLTDK
jgi:glycosyltransferase involved in cell wall biosynthesis